MAATFHCAGCHADCPDDPPLHACENCDGTAWVQADDHPMFEETPNIVTDEDGVAVRDENGAPLVEEPEVQDGPSMRRPADAPGGGN